MEEPPGDAARWDARHRAGAASERAPDPFVVASLAELGPGAGRRAVDLAAGAGRHALLLAEAGFDVEAWDVSPAGLARLAERASARGLVVRTRTVDLSGPLPGAAGPFDLACVVDFLDRGLLARAARLVRPGGHLVLATFTVDWPGEHPSPRFRLAAGEAARGVPGFRTLRASERGGRAGLLARRGRTELGEEDAGGEEGGGPAP